MQLSQYLNHSKLLEDQLIQVQDEIDILEIKASVIRKELFVNNTKIKRLQNEANLSKEGNIFCSRNGQRPGDCQESKTRSNHRRQNN